jgi:hypothetical protein
MENKEANVSRDTSNEEYLALTPGSMKKNLNLSGRNEPSAIGRRKSI